MILIILGAITLSILAYGYVFLLKTPVEEEKTGDDDKEQLLKNIDLKNPQRLPSEERLKMIDELNKPEVLN